MGSDWQGALRAELSQLAARGRSAPLLGELERELASGPLRVYARTRRVEAPLANTDNVLLFATAPGRLVAAVLSGQRADAGSAVACGVIASELDQAFAVETSWSDPASGLARAIGLADRRIRALGDAGPLDGEWRLPTRLGLRTHLGGIGACVAALVVTAGESGASATLGYVGDCDTALVRGEERYRIFTPHTLAEDPEFARRREPELDGERVVTKLVGSGVAQVVDLAELALSPGDRLEVTSASGQTQVRLDYRGSEG